MIIILFLLKHLHAVRSIMENKSTSLSFGKFGICWDCSFEFTTFSRSESLNCPPINRYRRLPRSLHQRRRRRLTDHLGAAGRTTTRLQQIRHLVPRGTKWGNRWLWWGRMGWRGQMGERQRLDWNRKRAGPRAYGRE